MNIQHWKIFDKAGHQLNWFPDSYINLQFTSPINGRNAAGFLITDPSGHAISSEITDSGYLYNETTTVSYTYTFDPNNATIPLVINSEVSIGYVDVSIFNPELVNTKGISNVSIIDLSTNFIYPSYTFGGAIFLKPVSVGLIETENLFILEVSAGNYIRPYDSVNSTIVIQMIGEEDEIKLFTVDDNAVEVVWSDVLYYDVSTYAENTPLAINIGFRAEEEGVFERRLRIYHVIGNEFYTLAEVIVNAQSIGEDERFRTLLGNFGLPDPKDFKDIFKETDINEDLPDWEILNYKSKHMILEHEKIMPYVGTYKALIHALKWLGYDDIYIREWFKNVKENKKLSLIVPFEAKDRTQTILMFSPEERKALKKLNQLSLNYAINYETGEVDDWGTPITANSYEYNLQEVFIKLMGLKQWLEKNIIGVNCKIIDITGEGIYFERFQNLIYSTGNVGYNYTVEQTLTPYAIDNNSELVKGDASIRLTFSELSKTKFSDLPYRFKDIITYLWNPLGDPSTYYDANDASILLYDPSLLNVLKVGPTFAFPFIHLSDIQWKASTEKSHGVIDRTLVTKPLFIYENDIKYYNPFDSSSIFHDISTNLKITLEEAFLRDPCIDIWLDSAVYKIYPNYEIYIDTSLYVTYPGTYTIISGSGKIYNKNVVTNYNGSLVFNVDTSVFITSSNTILKSPILKNYILKNLIKDTCTGIFNSFVSFATDTSNSFLQYTIDANYKVPLLSFKNYIATDINGNTVSFDGSMYYLDIQNGKISMDSGMVGDNYLTTYINFNYDTSLEEQKITMNVVYASPRETLFQVDPSIYYWADPSGRAGTTDPSMLTIDNSIHIMHVNHIGDYNLELFGWDGYNTILYNTTKDVYPVWVKTPTIYSLSSNKNLESPIIDASISMILSDVSILISNNTYPIYDRNIPLQGLTFEYDVNNNPYIKIPSITYFQDVPESNSINKIFNCNERVLSIDASAIVVDSDYQKFYSGDNVKLIKFDKGKYSVLAEASTRILVATGPINSRTLLLDRMPASISLDASSDVYILNDSSRNITAASNINSTQSKITITSPDSSLFQVNQLIAVIVTDASTTSESYGYSWGASYRIDSVANTQYTLNNLLPYNFVDDPARFKLTAKHAFSTYASFTIDTSYAREEGNYFKIYLKNDYNQQYYLDSTFVLINHLFDQEKVNSQWYDVSDNLVNSPFYYYVKPITTDASNLIILRAEFDNSTYMLNQKNIWTIKNSLDKSILLKVYNESVPYIFDVSNYYDVQVESYDSYGNLSTKYYEGLLNVI